MKISEIIKIDEPSEHGIELDKLKNAHFHIVYEKYLSLYFIEECKIGDELIFAISEINGKKRIAYLVSALITDLDLKYHKKILMITRTWCEPEFRKRGLISNLYRFLHRQMGYSLISDTKHSPDTIKIWNKLRSQWRVKMLDINTKEISDIDDKVLYGNEDKMMILEDYGFASKILILIEDYRFAMDED